VIWPGFAPGDVQQASVKEKLRRRSMKKRGRELNTAGDAILWNTAKNI